MDLHAPGPSRPESTTVSGPFSRALGGLLLLAGLLANEWMVERIFFTAGGLPSEMRLSIRVIDCALVLAGAMLSGWPALLGLLNIQPATLGHRERAGLLVGGLLLIHSFCATLIDNTRYGGVDLRAKVAPARAMLQGLDPYFYQFHPGMSEKLLDPTTLPGQPTRASYSPPTLCLYATFSGLPYKIQRKLWFLLEWTALLASLVLLTRSMSTQPRRLSFLVIGIYFFAAGPFWRSHLERGQYYVFLLFLLALAGARCGPLDRRQDSFPAGALIGVVAALRPTYIVLAGFLFLFKMPRAAAGLVVGFLLVVLATVPMTGLQAWSHFVKSVSQGEDLVRHEMQVSFDPEKSGVPTAAEGVNLTDMRPGEEYSVSLFRLCVQGQKRFARLAALASPGKMCKVVCVLFLLAAAGFARRSSAATVPARYALAFCLTVALALDYLLTVRFSYADILFLLPLAWLWPDLLDRSPPPWMTALMFSGLVLGQFPILFYPPLVRSLLFMAGLGALIIWFGVRGWPASSPPTPTWASS